MQAEINFSKSAIFELVNAAIEAYIVKHDYNRTISVETFSYLFGKVNKRLPLKCNIEHISVETSAKKRRGSVETKSVSYSFKRELSELFGNGFDYIGTMHSHPWLKGEECGSKTVESAENVRRYQLYRLSQADHQCEFGRHFAVSGRYFSVACTVTLFAMQRANDRKDFNPLDGQDIHEITLGNLKLWFYVQAFEHLAPSAISEKQKKDFEKYQLLFEDYKDYALIPVPIETSFNYKDFIEIFVAEGFGRFSIIEDKKTGLYFNKESSETRTAYKN